MLRLAVILLLLATPALARGSGHSSFGRSAGGHYLGGARSQSRVSSHSTFNGFRVWGASSMTRGSHRAHGLSKAQLKSLSRGLGKSPALSQAGYAAYLADVLR